MVAQGKEAQETTDFVKCPCDDCTAEYKLIDEWGYFCDLACGQRSHWISRCRGHQDVLKAGYRKPLDKLMGKIPDRETMADIIFPFRWFSSNNRDDALDLADQILPLLPIGQPPLDTPELREKILKLMAPLYGDEDVQYLIAPDIADQIIALYPIGEPPLLSDEELEELKQKYEQILKVEWHATVFYLLSAAIKDQYNSNMEFYGLPFRV